MRDIGKNIRSLRIRKNMTQEELADKLFVTRQTVSNYETGRSRPDVETLFRIAEILSADINDLLYEPEDTRQKRKRIVIVSVIAAVMAVLGVLMQQFADFAQDWMARNYRPGLSILVMFLRPVYYILLGYLFMGSIRFLQKAAPLSVALRKRIGWIVAAGLALMILVCLLYWGVSVLNRIGVGRILLKLIINLSAFFFTAPGAICYPLILGLVLGLSADWKAPSQT